MKAFTFSQPGDVLYFTEKILTPGVRAQHYISGTVLWKVIAKPETWYCTLTPVSLEDGTAWRIFLKCIHKA